MGFTTWAAEVKDMQRNLSELLASNTAEEEAASLEIAQSASRFSRRARKVVDDKLSFSATLMRAGEVSAATRLLAEVEEEVITEEIALIETVNEVKVAQAVRKGRITRLRLARSLAVALLGACILAFSAVGMAVAGAFQEKSQTKVLAPLKLSNRRDASPAGEARKLSLAARRQVRRLQIGNVQLVLTKNEFQRLAQLTGGDLDQADLDQVLALLSGSLAQKVEEAMTAASEVVASAASSAPVDPTPALKKLTRAKKKAVKPASEPSPASEDQESQDAQDPEGSNPSPQPEPEPKPSPSETEEGDSGEGEEEGTVIPGGVPSS